MNITKPLVRKLLRTVNFGLAAGVGEPVPGQMCIEAAVCYALGEPHGDRPSCVAKSVRGFKIDLNDASWSSNKARAAGMRQLAIAQLGSKGKAKRFNALLRRELIVHVLSARVPDPKLASLCRSQPTTTTLREIQIAYRNSDKHYSVAGMAITLKNGGLDLTWRLPQEDEWLILIAQCAVRVMKKLRFPGTRFLSLCK